MSRAKKTKHVFGEETLNLTKEQKRFATPEGVAVYRAKRLACSGVLIDLCCGAGFQSFAFAQHAGYVIGIDIDAENIRRAKEYAHILGIENVTFLCGDVLAPEIVARVDDIVAKHGGSFDVVFCDPQRLPTEKERSLATIQPSVEKLLDVYGQRTKNVAIELPPHIKGTNFSAEYEYLTVNGALNRLTLYFGALKQSVKSVVLLPSCDKLDVSSQEADDPAISARVSSVGYIYVLEPNPAVVVADAFFAALCVEQDAKNIKESIAAKEIVVASQGKKIFFLSKEKIMNPFFTTYKIEKRLKHKDDRVHKDNVVVALQAMDAGKVVLRYPIAPNKYWAQRSYFERPLSGSKQVHFFLFDMAVLCTRLE